MRSLLLVEDDGSLGATLRERLEKEGYRVEWCETFAGASEVARMRDFDLAILDVNLPDGSGFDLAREVRRRHPTPFIFMTAMNSAEHRLQGYELGAEEYIPKPFHLKELLIRVRHVLETHPSVSETVNQKGSVIDLADRALDLTAQAVIFRNGEKEFIAARDFQLLKFLIDSAPRVVSRDDILNRVWGEDRFPSHRTVDNSIVRLRAILGHQSVWRIRSVRGVGYQWTESEGA